MGGSTETTGRVHYFSLIGLTVVAKNAEKQEVDIKIMNSTVIPRLILELSEFSRRIRLETTGILR